MQYRYHGPKRGPGSSGKWQRMPHSGVGTVLSETDGTWQIHIAHRRTGTTIRRDVYSVTIQNQEARHEERMSGFASKNAAIEAARKRITLLDGVHRRQAVRRGGSPPAG